MANHQAMFWEYDDALKKVKCYLCPQFCIIPEGKNGLCNTRTHINKELIAINYGEVTSISLDPIEKKPLYHFKPGKNILSLGTFGCNMRCGFCQNYTISQQRAKSELINVEAILQILSDVDSKDNIGLSFTYNEPFMWYEFIYDIAREIKKQREDLAIVMVSNGYVNEEPLLKLLPYIDALNIDLKAYSNGYYSKICGAKLEPVLNTIEIASKHSHVEITTLMVTNENDSLTEIEEIAKFISHVNKDIPLHLSRYYPQYKMSHPPTDMIRMSEASDIAKKYLNYVYLGNVGNRETNTHCPECNELLIDRKGYNTQLFLKENKCPKCSIPLSIIL